MTSLGHGPVDPDYNDQFVKPQVSSLLLPALSTIAVTLAGKKGSTDRQKDNMPVLSVGAVLDPPAIADPLPGQSTAPHLTLLATPLAPTLAIAPSLALIPPILAPSLALAWPPMACGAPPGHWQGS